MPLCFWLSVQYKVSVVGQDLHLTGGSEFDFSAELSKVRAAKPDALFVFYPGAAGAQFLNQYVQSGLKGQVPLDTGASTYRLAVAAAAGRERDRHSLCSALGSMTCQT